MDLKSSHGKIQLAETDDVKHEEIIEEDWSHILNEKGEKDSSERFAFYDTINFPLSSEISKGSHPPLTMKLLCMESLTPLDMLDLSNGRADATGNRIWMGALLFMECMSRPLQPGNEPTLDGAVTITSNEKHNISRNSKTMSLLHLRKDLFQNKKVLELGAGTGASLISVGLVGKKECDIKPSLLTFTDNDPDVLSLCEKNCSNNLNKEDVTYRVCRLDWGKESLDLMLTGNGDIQNPWYMDPSLYHSSSQDTVIATDVIYDLSALQPLFETASFMVKNGGYFVLSHIPRAHIDCSLNGIQEALEAKIIEEASRHNFTPIRNYDVWHVSDALQTSRENDANADYAIRPDYLRHIWGDSKNLMVSSDCDYEEMDSTGASILIFLKSYS